MVRETRDRTLFANICAMLALRPRGHVPRGAPCAVGLNQHVARCRVQGLADDGVPTRRARFHFLRATRPKRTLDAVLHPFVDLREPQHVKFQIEECRREAGLIACSRKPRRATASGTAASRWVRDCREPPRRRSRPAAARCWAVGPAAGSKADRKACRYSADAGRIGVDLGSRLELRLGSDLELGFASSRGMRR